VANSDLSYFKQVDRALAEVAAVALAELRKSRTLAAFL